MDGAALDVGTAQGRVAGAWTGTDVRVWLGIPYAAPPVGELRWRAPQPAQPWPGVRPALDFGCELPQPPNTASQRAPVGEDCLHVNVWSPAGAEPGSLPVMVWIHGGGFLGGGSADARCDGAALARRGVVVASFNYRTGLYGWLAHPALSAESAQRTSGNYGLLDQLAALAWVRDNIAGFGGDPRRITVFGVSAGSASIALLLTAPQAAGAFDRAILHSPGTARPLASLADAEAAGRALGDDIGALRALDAQALYALTPKLAPAVRGLTAPRVLRPIRDGWLLPSDERPAFAAGRLHAMPVVIGTNADEGTALTRSWPIATVAEHDALLAADFAREAGRALALYPAAADADALPSVAEAFADTQFNAGARLLARTMARLGGPVWRYRFTRRRPGQPDGPHHGDEVGHAFGNTGVERVGTPARRDAVDDAVSAAMATAWTAFARDGDPNAPGLSCTWPRFDERDPWLLEFGDRIAPLREASNARLDFIDAYLAGT